MQAGEKLYYDFGDFLKKYFDFKVQKISINAGFTCPNRDGTKGVGGCTYCNNQTFNPEYCKTIRSVTEQLEEGKRFFARKYPQMKFLAYFQAYTNTYGDVEKVIGLYEEALRCEDVVGLIIGTRPDCMPDELLQYLSALSKNVFVLVEYGVETSNNNTLKLINRGHTWEETVDAIKRTHDAGVLCGAHIILGLPGETKEDFIATARAMSSTEISTIKIHQLQLIKGTLMAKLVLSGELEIVNWDVNGYIEMCGEMIRNISQDIAIERFVSQSPASLLISPKWGLKNYEFTNLLNNYIKCENIKQGASL